MEIERPEQSGRNYSEHENVKRPVITGIVKSFKTCLPSCIICINTDREIWVSVTVFEWMFHELPGYACLINPSQGQYMAVDHGFAF